MAKAQKQRRAPTERPGEIIDAALALFVEKGFAATRLDDVAERAGLSKAAIYLYFADKTALFKGVIEQAVGRNLGAVEAMLAQHRGPVGPLLSTILEFMATRIETTPMASVAKLVIAELRAFPEIGRYYLDQVIGRGLPLLEQLIRRGIASGEFRNVDPGLTVRSIVGPMLLAGIWRTVFEPIGAESLDVRALARHHADLMLHALRPDWRHEMKRAPFIALAAIITILLATRDWWEAPVFNALGFTTTSHYLGYVEGETSLVAPPSPAASPSGRSTAATASRRATASS